MGVNVKDYGEKAMAALSAMHDVNWFKGVTEPTCVTVHLIETQLLLSTSVIYIHMIHCKM